MPSGDEAKAKRGGRQIYFAVNRNASSLGEMGSIRARSALVDIERE
jgi:hypothetical protein